MTVDISNSELSPEYWFISVEVVPPPDAASKLSAQTLSCLLLLLLLLPPDVHEFPLVSPDPPDQGRLVVSWLFVLASGAGYVATPHSEDDGAQQVLGGLQE